MRRCARKRRSEAHRHFQVYDSVQITKIEQIKFISKCEIIHVTVEFTSDSEAELMTSPDLGEWYSV